MHVFISDFEISIYLSTSFPNYTDLNNAIAKFGLKLYIWMKFWTELVILDG